MKLDNSPVEQITFRERKYFVKRDDLLSPHFSGNKARKLCYFLQNDFPDINKVIGYGSPQANLLYSLSELAKLKHWQFDFYVNHIPDFLADNPAGNYLAAKNNGANVISLQGEGQAKNTADYIQEHVLPKENNSLFVPEGGRNAEAEYGVKQLADEILLWAEQTGVKNLKVALPSGTGTTALFLQKNLPVEVLTCACVGGDEYLTAQFFELSADEADHPTILKTDRKYHFGKLYREFFDIWNALKQETNITFELIYDPLGWITLLEYCENNIEEDVNILYIHQGGLLGNDTMIPRYQRLNRLSVNN